MKKTRTSPLARFHGRPVETPLAGTAVHDRQIGQKEGTEPRVRPRISRGPTEIQKKKGRRV